MSGSYRDIESFSQSLEGLRSALSQKINALTGTGRVTVGVEDGPKNSTRGGGKRKKNSARNNSNCISSKSFQLFCLMTKVFVGAAAVAAGAADAAAAVATLTMNLALRQKRRNTHTHIQLGGKKD